MFLARREGYLIEDREDGGRWNQMETHGRFPEVLGGERGEVCASFLAKNAKEAKNGKKTWNILGGQEAT